MSIFQIFLVAVGVALDAFAVSLAHGVSMPGVRVNSGETVAAKSRNSFLSPRLKVWIKGAGIVGLWFGGFQLVMALIGYFVGDRLKFIPENATRWLVFGIFLILSILMLREAFMPGSPRSTAQMFSARKMAPLALATSIDSLAIGVTLALTGTNPWLSTGLIGVVTLVLSAIGFVTGSAVGSKLEFASQLVGAGLLLAVGIKVLLGI
ncbi:MAG: manganese efflux pump MntP family protein [Bifidobacteriaceae bacterium]|jgi:putative Mn2+ efflux pump MntP|nr:manganese efflux pump MntP family protein [Bifidobacteriaceae bacterium]MCI1978713.1 manganese efflux pump MntP family protein [Bifidobacteriaceae bacterium]